MTIGFVNYDEPVAVPTVAELLAALTGPQRIGILNGFAARTSVQQLKAQLGLRSSIIIFFYAKLKEIEMKATEIMRSGFPAASAVALGTAVESYFTDFTSAQVGAVIDKIVSMSKSDGTGDWTWYSSKVIA